MSFQQGLSGLNGAQKALDAVSNNVANAGTVGFKLAQAQFADVFAASLSGGGGSQIGIGSTISNVAQQFSQGNITVTSNPLDIAINGAGFFRLSDNGAVSYTRNGQFQVDKNGFVVNAQGLRLTGFPADTLGNIIPSSPSDIFIDTADLNPQPTSAAQVGMNLDSRGVPPTLAFVPAAPSPLSYNSSTSITVYDSLGNPHVMTMYLVKTATPRTWDLWTSVDNGTAVQGAAPANQMVFDASGNLTSPAAPITQSFAVTTGANTPLAFTLDFRGSTQFGSPFGVNRLTQDGFTSGRLSGISVSPDGIVQGRYSNGQARNLSQIVLANFNNPNGLTSLGGNQWAETSESGQPLVGSPDSGSLGVLQSAAIEESNVDLTQELVNMITQQRNYQANAQSIKTQDQVLQTLVNLR